MPHAVEGDQELSLKKAGEERCHNADLGGGSKLEVCRESGESLYLLKFP